MSSELEWRQSPAASLPLLSRQRTSKLAVLSCAVGLASCATAFVGFLAIWDAVILTALLGLFASIALGITSVVRIGRCLDLRGKAFAWAGVFLPLIACSLGLLALPAL